jgi:hypothetical protein
MITDSVWSDCKDEDRDLGIECGNNHNGDRVCGVNDEQERRL